MTEDGTNAENQKPELDGALVPKPELTDMTGITNPVAIELQNDVKTTIQSHEKSGTIRKRVVDTLVEEEVSYRADLLTKALAKRKAQAKELDKIKPDQCSFNVDGTLAFENWTKAKLTERQKSMKDLAKIDKAINTAVNNADYEGVKKIAQ